MKKMGLFSLVVFAGLLFLSSPVYAAPEWVVNCSLVTVGVMPNGNPWIKMTDQASTPKFTNKNFTVSSNAGANGTLATALTALSLGVNVSVNVDYSVTPGLIYNILVINNP